MKILLKILLSLLLIAYLVVVLGFVGKEYDAVLCKGMEVIIKDSLKTTLISPPDIKNMVRLEHKEVAGVPVKQLDVSGMEETLGELPAIAQVEVYTDVEGRLLIEISQRDPVVRIEDRDHSVYYLDREGYIIPPRPGYSPRILHVNGWIPGKFRQLTNVGDSESGSTLMEEIVLMAEYINGDPFWRSQIVQLFVNRENEFELIPRVGSQIILFGTAERMEDKFFKLKTLYRDGFRYTGWNQYGQINLKYNNQVICTKR